MANRKEERVGAIVESLETEVDNEPMVEGELTSRYVYEAVGVPNDSEVIAAIDAWANTWGDVIHPTMGDEGLYDDSNPKHVAAMEEFDVVTEALEKALPGVSIRIGLILFEGGHVQLST